MGKRFKAELIKEYLKENNLSKTEFCRQCKMSVVTLNKILSGNYNVTIVALFKIARVMNINLGDFFAD